MALNAHARNAFLKWFWNQIVWSCAGKSYGYIDYFGMHPDIDYKLLINKIKSSLSTVNKNSFIDSNGSKRIKNKIMKMLKKWKCFSLVQMDLLGKT